MKKAQGLSLNIVIVAAIVLIVLIVLWAIFTGRMGGFVRGLEEAEKQCGDLCTATGSTLASFNENTCAADKEVRQMNVRTDDGTTKTYHCCCT